MISRVMLADNKFNAQNDRDMAALMAKLPLLASAKFDGVRAHVQGGVLLSRSMKPIRNEFVQDTFGRLEYEGLDGELIKGEPFAPDVYRKTMSAVMSYDGEPKDVRFFVFDMTNCEEDDAFNYRLEVLAETVKRAPKNLVLAVSQRMIYTAKELLEYEAKVLDLGFEGLILRSPSGPYKQGRSTFREGYMLKLKRFVDSEAVVIGMTEKMHNANEATLDERGYTKRSHAQAGKKQTGTMGSLCVRDLKTKEEFYIGTGFADVGPESRAWWWSQRAVAKGIVIVYKRFPMGAYTRPRHPVYKGIRDKIDRVE